MRLKSLRLQNFRQHVDTRIKFENGLTGIIGPNGAGKSTLLEAIAWALYGNSAARGTRDSIRFSRAAPRASVRVELEFELAGHSYRIIRGITTAECFLDGGDEPIANTITGVSELMQRRLGMTRTEFFHTYFTGQKEIDVMSTLGPADRARFLSRVLGYDRISGAQELVRDRRRALQAEINGLKQGIPDADEVGRGVADAADRLALTRKLERKAEKTRINSSTRLSEIAPRWIGAQAERDRLQKLIAEIRVKDQEIQSATREIERIEGELRAMEAARKEVVPLLKKLHRLPVAREELTLLETLAAADARKQALLERENAIAEEDAKLADRALRLETAPALEQETLLVLQKGRTAMELEERDLDAQRTAWARDRQEAETRLESLRVQYTDLASQRKALEGLGEESPCPTCGRPLGASFHSVVELLSEQIETARADGNYFRQRVEQLKTIPSAISALEDRRRATHAAVTSIDTRLARIQAGLAERTTLAQGRALVAVRLAEARAALAKLPTGYDATQHKLLREEVAKLSEISTRAARLEGIAEREEDTRVKLARLSETRGLAHEKRDAFEQERASDAVGEMDFEAVRAQHERASTEARRAEMEAITASSDSKRAEAQLASAEARRDELTRLQTRLAQLELDRRMHDELDRAFTDLRTDLNFQLRPELAEIASGFLSSLTDGRYSQLEFDEEYNLLVLEDEVPKPVISGGEEDLCNLVLRLAISQMIADRAGQAFSLLILDEIFGSLDDTRRGNVVDLLRRLNDRFEQVIVITHVEQIREGMDRVLVVRFDEEKGSSRVTNGFDDHQVTSLSDLDLLTPELSL